MWIVFGFISIAFHIYLIFSGLVPNLISRPLHFALILPWIFLYNNEIKFQFLINVSIVITGMTSCFYIAIFSNQLMEQYGFLENKLRRSDLWQREELSKYLNKFICEECNGSRLKKEALSIKINKCDICKCCFYRYGHFTSNDKVKLS